MPNKENKQFVCFIIWAVLDFDAFIQVDISFSLIKEPESSCS